MKAFCFLLISLCAVAHCDSSDWGAFVSHFDDFDDYTSLLDFELEYSEGLERMASLLCAVFDYMEVFMHEESPFSDKFLTLRDSVCSPVNSNDRVDLSYLEECVWGDYEDCWKTGKLEFLLGTTVDKDFFYFVNSSSAVKRKQVAKCLQDEGCTHRDEAVDLLNEWNSIIADCDQMSEDQVVDAVLGAGMHYNDYNMYDNDYGDHGDYDYEVYRQGYYNGISNCLRITPSDKVKRAISNALNNTAVCSKVLQDHILNYIEQDLQVPFDVVMDLSRKLMSCNNRSVERMFEKMLAERDPDEFRAGSAIWELMKMMNEENELLRQRRENAMPLDEFLSGLVVSPNLKYKWDSNPLIWRYSYKTNCPFQGEVIYSIVATMGKELNDPLSVTISEVYQYPPLETHLTFAIQSPLLKELVDIMEGKLQNVEDVVNLVRQLITQEGMWYPFKFSTVFMYDDINYDSETFLSAYNVIISKWYDLYEQFLNDDVPERVTIKMKNFGGTKASFLFDYGTLSTSQPSLKLFTVAATTTYGELFLNATTVLNNILNGIEADGSLYLWALANYTFEGHMEAITEWTDDKNNCEMSFIVKKAGNTASRGQEVMRLSSCIRPIYLSNINEPIEILTSTYRVLEIPNWLKVNLTMDFGENGDIFKFINTPKQLITTIEYANQVVFDSGLKIQNVVDTKKSQDTDAPVFTTETSAYLKLPALTINTGTIKVISDIYGDLSAKSSYHMSSMNSPYMGSPFTYEGSFDLTSCSPGAEDFFSNILLKQEMPKMPKKICYDFVLELPNNMGHVKQLLKYSKSGDIYYSYDINVDVEWEVFAFNGNFTKKEGYEGFNYVTSPFAGAFKFSTEQFETIPSKNESLMCQLDLDPTGHYFFLNPPKEGLVSKVLKGKPLALVFTAWRKFEDVFELFAEDDTTYAICSFAFLDNEYDERFRSVCDFEAVHGAHLSINLYDKIIVDASQADLGRIYAVVSEDNRAQANLYDGKFEYANFSATYNNEDKDSIQVFFKPMSFSEDKSQPMCHVLNYEFGSTVARSDTECVQDFMKKMGFADESLEFLDNFSEIDVDESGEMLMEAVDENLKTLTIDELRMIVRQYLDVFIYKYWD